ncbi:sulfite exporter TauE/SafE family protein [Streptomyces longispororuber]|uniref:sulfite exporter TauE/SafE family protein n=1 Tax=Streptomyces longispororuber TaxID=68230 RepID=UPI00210ABB33|nr:sulfite exporter TauE/SafE family protein [Streptomyces longispororuber]MCQ4212867.1 sulfite exporter TauE/SafE family protein [Streptomyces longispororuber]
MDAVDWCALLTVALAAGWLDAVVGGGGLVQVPALMVLLPTAPVATLLGTNKLVAITGTSSAAVTYARRVGLDAPHAFRAGLIGVPTSLLGALTAAWLPQRVFVPVVLVSLLAAAAVGVWSVRGGTGGGGPRFRWPTRWTLTAVGLIGYYSGAVGSGTGVLLVALFTAALGTGFLQGSATAKAVSIGTDLGALALFASLGHVLWATGAAMALANITGGAIGARTAIRRGAGFVRAALLCTVAALVTKLAIDHWA